MKLNSVAEFFILNMLERHGAMSVGELFTAGANMFEEPITTAKLYEAQLNLVAANKIKRTCGTVYELVEKPDYSKEVAEAKQTISNRRNKVFDD